VIAGEWVERTFCAGPAIPVALIKRVLIGYVWEILHDRQAAE
jgi:hypothetical protein